jgi:tRNA modification GTPase
LERSLGFLPWNKPGAAGDALKQLLDTERLGRALWQPPTVVLVGPTNAGKSTLFNALAREERVIVSPAPGTTRDTVSAEVAVGGLPVWLVDTAGQREAESAIEHEAIERARAAAAAADMVLVVLDASGEVPPPSSEFLGILPKAPLVVLNTSDVGLATWAKGVPNAVPCSAATGDGVGPLGARVVSELVGEARYEAGRAVVFTERQGRLLRTALERLDAGDAVAAREQVRECLGYGPEDAG